MTDDAFIRIIEIAAWPFLIFILFQIYILLKNDNKNKQ